MDFSWTKEQEALKESAISFFQSINRLDIQKPDRNSTFPREQWLAYAGYGVMGLNVPKSPA